MFLAENCYKMLFKGIVLVEKFENLVVISKGDEFVFELNRETLKSVVNSIELNRELVSTNAGNERIDVLI